MIKALRGHFHTLVSLDREVNVDICHAPALNFFPECMERLYMEAQDGLKTIDPPLFLNIFFYFLLV